LIVLLRQVGEHEDGFHHFVFVPPLDTLLDPVQLILDQQDAFVLFSARGEVGKVVAFQLRERFFQTGPGNREPAAAPPGSQGPVEIEQQAEKDNQQGERPPHVAEQTRIRLGEFHHEFRAVHPRFLPLR